MKSILPSRAVRRFAVMIPLLVAPMVGVRVAAAETAPLRATQPAGQPATPPAPAAAMIGGKVLETMDAATYTYARVETPAGEKWIAGPRTSLKIGDAVEWAGGNEMKNFPSKTLGRTFESIVFVDRILVGGASTAKGGTAPHASLSEKETADADVKGIEKADGGFTIAEIFDRRSDLEGKDVVVRGKVVKYNGGVMKRNWLHLRDGSQGAAGDNDLTVTSDDQATVGDVVVVRGKLVLNKDFGFNYRYDVMIEGAKVTVEPPLRTTKP